MKGGSKNNIENRGTAAKLRQVNGKNVIPVEFRDTTNGRRYMAAFYEDFTPVAGKDGHPIPYNSIVSTSQA